MSRVKELLLSALSPEQLVLTLLEAEPPNVLVSRPSAPFTEASMMMSLTKLADKELVHMIGWAKKIPGRALWVLAFCVFVERPAPTIYGARVQSGGPQKMFLYSTVWQLDLQPVNERGSFFLARHLHLQHGMAWVTRFQFRILGLLWVLYQTWQSRKACIGRAPSILFPALFYPSPAASHLAMCTPNPACPPVL